MSLQRATSVDRKQHPGGVQVVGFEAGSRGPTSHYAVPKSMNNNNVKIQLVPDFHQGREDMGMQFK